MEISYSVSALLAELRAPRGITNENFAGSVPIPPVTATALERNFVEAIVNRFIAVAENRPVGADLIISRPKRPLASCHDQLRSIGITAFVIDVDNLSFLEPFNCPRDSGDNAGRRFFEAHQEQDDFGAFTAGKAGHFVIARRTGF